MQLNENRVRERAYQIWEAEGKPEGCADKHWSLACQYEEATLDDQTSSYNSLSQDTDSLSEAPPKKKAKQKSH